MSISVPAGAILARASDKDLKIDSLQTISAAIELTTNNDLKPGEYEFDLSGDLIKIYMEENTRQLINLSRQSNNRILYPNIYMVTLIHAIQNVEKDGTRAWEVALKKKLVACNKKINEKLQNDAYKIAQELLDYPRVANNE